MEASPEMLAEVAQEIFENLVYISPQPPDEESEPSLVQVRASVRFQGPFSGTVSLGVSEGLLPELALNMLGVDKVSGDSGKKGRDALGEVTNVLCGNLLARLAGPEPVFDLGVPQVESVPAAEAEAELPQAPGQTAVRLEMEGGRLEVCFKLDGQN